MGWKNGMGEEKNISVHDTHQMTSVIYTVSKTQYNQLILTLLQLGQVHEERGNLEKK
jgi:hypothetical protein